MCGIMLVLRAVFNMLVRNASPRGPMCYRYLMFKLPLGPDYGMCDVISLYCMCCSVNVSVCIVCCVFDSVCELFGETIRNMFGCVFYFVVECDGVVECGWMYFIG